MTASLVLSMRIVLVSGLTTSDRGFGDARDRAGAVAGGAEDRDVLSAVQTVIAAAIEHHHVAGRAHLAAFVAEHQVARVREVRFTGSL